MKLNDVINFNKSQMDNLSDDDLKLLEDFTGLNKVSGMKYVYSYSGTFDMGNCKMTLHTLFNDGCMMVKGFTNVNRLHNILERYRTDYCGLISGSIIAIRK